MDIIGLNVIPTEDAMIMKHEVPESERIAAQAGDYIGIFHENNEIGLTYCNENVAPEHANWMESWSCVVCLFLVFHYLAVCKLNLLSFCKDITCLD